MSNVLGNTYQLLRQFVTVMLAEAKGMMTDGDNSLEPRMVQPSPHWHCPHHFRSRLPHAFITSESHSIVSSSSAPM